MNPFRVGIISFAVLCFLVGLAIFYRKAVSPWLIDRDDEKARKIQEAERQAAEFKRRQAKLIVNGRSQRTDPPLRRKIGGRDV